MCCVPPRFGDPVWSSTVLTLAILMLHAVSPTIRLMIFVNVAVVFLAALALRTLFHAQAETAALLGFAEPSLATRLILCALLQPLCIFLHECGHLAAGLALDQKCRKIDRKSTRLNSSHLGISYAVFC